MYVSSKEKILKGITGEKALAKYDEELKTFSHKCPRMSREALVSESGCCQAGSNAYAALVIYDEYIEKFAVFRGEDKSPAGLVRSCGNGKCGSAPLVWEECYKLVKKLKEKKQTGEQTDGERLEELEKVEEESQ